jgi:hypothetical protein
MKWETKRGKEGERQTLERLRDWTECTEENKDYVRK